MMKPPMMKVLATTMGVNRCSLITLPNSRPSTTAGRKPISHVEREAPGLGLSRQRGHRVEWIFCQYTMITARIAPVWIAMSNTLALASSKPPSSAPGKDQVAGRRDRQEFGQALDDAHDGGLDQQNDIHACSFERAWIIARARVR